MRSPRVLVRPLILMLSELIISTHVIPFVPKMSRYVEGKLHTWIRTGIGKNGTIIDGDHCTTHQSTLDYYYRMWAGIESRS